MAKNGQKWPKMAKQGARTAVQVSQQNPKCLPIKFNDWKLSLCKFDPINFL
jgi:hypothetical protein